MTYLIPFILVYLMGVATPILCLRQFLRSQGDNDACLPEAILIMLGVIFVWLVVVWIRAN